MSAMGWIVMWGALALASAVAGGVVAYGKRRDHSFWAAWCFILPPVLLLLVLLPANRFRDQPRSLDEEDREHA